MDVVCLQETKWRSCSNKISKSLMPNRFVKWGASCSEGASSGIMILWDSTVVQLVGLEESCHTLSCRFSNCGDNFSWVFTSLYGPSKRDLRKEFGEDWGQSEGCGKTHGALGVILMF